MLRGRAAAASGSRVTADRETDRTASSSTAGALSGAPAGQAGTAGSDDYYARRVSSPEYRESRVDRAKVILHLVGERFVAADRIADIGSGTGIMKTALEVESGKTLYGFELDVPFVVDRARVIGADACRLPAGGGTFDLVLLNHIYEHVGDQQALFREAWRVLAPGGVAYVSAGSRFAVMEPHYRLPFLSWLPRRTADRYLRASGRGESYEGVRFLTYGALMKLMIAPGFEVRDITEQALRELLSPDRGPGWRPAWGVLSRMPGAWRRGLLRVGSPQWFFLLVKPTESTGS